MSQHHLKAVLGGAVPRNFHRWPCSQVWPYVQYRMIALQESSEEAFMERNGVGEVVSFLSLCSCETVGKKEELYWKVLRAR